MKRVAVLLAAVLMTAPTRGVFYGIAKDKKQIVHYLNNCRKGISWGKRAVKGDKRCPEAEYMARLEWSNALEKVATNFVNQCQSTTQNAATKESNPKGEYRRAKPHSDAECGKMLAGVSHGDLQGYEHGDKCSELLGFESAYTKKYRHRWYEGTEESIAENEWIAQCQQFSSLSLSVLTALFLLTCTDGPTATL